MSPRSSLHLENLSFYEQNTKRHEKLSVRIYYLLFYQVGIFWSFDICWNN